MMSMLTPGLVEAWFPCGTKFGKSAGAGSSMSSAAWVKKNGLFRWVAPIHSQAKIGMKYHTRLIPHEAIQVNKSEPSIRFRHNDAIIEFKSGKFPEDLEGEGVDGGYCIDEAAKMGRQVYDSAKTTVTVTRAPIVAFSTPKGKNWFYHKCMEAKEEMEWAIKNGQSPKKIFMTAPSIVNPMVTPEAVAEAKIALPDRLFRQYYLAEFLDDGSTFLGFRETYYTEKIELVSEHQQWFSEDCAQLNVVIGADWAKTQDWTVFFAVCLNTRRVVAFERFHKRPYTEAIKQLVRFSRRFKDVLDIWHDKTGVGQAIDDQLAYTKLQYRGITFSNRSKTDMVNKLITTIESRRISLPFWNVLDSEMDAYEVSTNDLGTMSYSAPPGKHDDTVSALMLANAALDEYADRDYDVRFMDELDEEDSKVEPDSLEAYYNDLKDDEDF
jgi:hypothetical protein